MRAPTPESKLNSNFRGSLAKPPQKAWLVYVGEIQEPRSRDGVSSCSVFTRRGGLELAFNWESHTHRTPAQNSKLENGDLNR